jgi:hypothetical protein
MLNKWIYYVVAAFLVLIYYAGEATGLLVIAMFVILPLGWWVINKMVDPNS